MYIALKHMLHMICIVGSTGIYIENEKEVQKVCLIEMDVKSIKMRTLSAISFRIVITFF